MIKAFYFLAAFVVMGYAADPVATFHSVYLKYQANKPKDMTDSAYIPSSQMGHSFRARVTYAGEIRPISGDNRQCLIFLEGMLGLRNIFRAYKTEMHIVDSDSMDYWVPVLEQRVNAIRRKCQGRCCALELQVIWFLNFHTRPFAVITDFKLK